MLATVGPSGLDCSPRGDAAGFVEVLDEKTLIIWSKSFNITPNKWNVNTDLV